MEVRPEPQTEPQSALCHAEAWSQIGGECWRTAPNMLVATSPQLFALVKRKSIREYLLRVRGHQMRDADTWQTTLAEYGKEAESRTETTSSRHAYYLDHGVKTWRTDDRPGRPEDFLEVDAPGPDPLWKKCPIAMP